MRARWVEGRIFFRFKFNFTIPETMLSLSLSFSQLLAHFSTTLAQLSGFSVRPSVLLLYLEKASFTLLFYAENSMYERWKCFITIRSSCDASSLLYCKAILWREFNFVRYHCDVLFLCGFCYKFHLSFHLSFSVPGWFTFFLFFFNFYSFFL